MQGIGDSIDVAARPEERITQREEKQDDDEKSEEVPEVVYDLDDQIHQYEADSHTPWRLGCRGTKTTQIEDPCQPLDDDQQR